MDVNAFEALCNTVRRHLNPWDKQQAVISDLTERYLALCKDPSKLVEALLAIKDGNPERDYTGRNSEAKTPCIAKQRGARVHVESQREVSC
jgi:hypothetical protein